MRRLVQVLVSETIRNGRRRHQSQIEPVRFVKWVISLLGSGGVGLPWFPLMMSERH
jgi:hypothetical protein